MQRIAKFEKVSFEQFKKDWQGEHPQDAEEVIREIYDGIRLPKRATAGSAGYDFFAPAAFTLKPGQMTKILTGIRARIDDGWVLKLYPRSGLGFKFRLQLNNTVGIIDSDYFYSDNEGHIFIKMTNDTREGKTVERKARTVKIFDIQIETMDLPEVTMTVSCSKGTYIRTLCQDIGEKLSCGACMESLLRTKVSEFCVQDALRLSEIEERVQKAAGQTPSEQWNAEMFDFIYAVDSVFLQYKKAVICKEWNKLLYNGNRMKKDMFVSYQKDWEQQKVRIYDEEGRFIGIYRYDKRQENYKPVKIFLEQ